MAIFSPNSAQEPASRTCTAFVGTRRLASGDILDVAAAAKRALEADPTAAVLIFDDESARVVEVDFRGSVEAVQERLRQQRRQAAAPIPTADAVPKPGRPKLGVVAREVTLLPRHWDWLSRQPGGASVALRRLVDEARKASRGRDVRRNAQETAYRFMQALAGDLPGFEEATRALFAGNPTAFATHTASWPKDIQAHATLLATGAWDE